MRSIMSSGYSVSLFTDWQHKRINEVWIKRRVEKADTSRCQTRVLWSTTRDQESSPDRRTLGGELHGADGSARPLV